ncbi:nucleotidyltransferase family protein [Paenarthrobacter sp. NPDC056912]|uniref:nucleotidyltransferase family protein n=1 Tax=Paenarthrobacter sp. NPDC056912 TaxID=3345965 RepID=UPI00366FBF82
MTSWVATAYGALDLRGWHENQSDVEVMLLATLPSEPIGLAGMPAGLWRKLIEGPVQEGDLQEDERALVHEFEAAGIASRNAAHPARILELNVPWLSSPVHEMVYALVGSVARDHGVDVVAIKGPMLHRQGLRAREHSGDVDVWVDPRSMEALCDAFESWGWNGQADQWSGLSFNHSVALEPGAWGCELDVHRHVPGCAEADSVVFAKVMQSSEKTMFAGVSMLTPELAAHAVILALHDLRPEARHGKTSAEAEEHAEKLRLAGERALEFAHGVKASAVLEPTLRLAFPAARLRVDHEIPMNWKWRESKGWWRAYWMIFTSLPPEERLLFLRRAVWPQAEVLAASEIRAGRSMPSLVAARFRRIGKLFRW